MINKSPFNYLITLAFACILWVISAHILGNLLGDIIYLETLPVEDFIFWYRIFITIAGVLSLLITYYWYFYGNKDTTAGELDAAKRMWFYLFTVQVTITAVIFVAKVIIFRNEGIAFKHYLVILGALSLFTWLFFWISTFFMSPNAVKYLVPFKK